MKNGVPMPRGIELAVPVALRRGFVGVFIRSLVAPAELLITGGGRFVLVGLRYARRFSAGIAEIEAEFAEAIAALRLLPRTGPVRCELWLYSRYGSLRHFDVADDGLTELDAYGMPLDAAKPEAAPGLPAATPPVAPGAEPAPAEKPGAPLENRGHVLRWLAKWNAARLAGKTVAELESGRLRNLLDAVRPVSIARRNRKKIPEKKIPAMAGEPAGEKDPAAENRNTENPGTEKFSSSDPCSENFSGISRWSCPKPG